MLTFQSHPQEAKAMQIVINSGRYFSITFIKADNSIRYANGHKHNYGGTSSEEERRGKYNRLDKNILLVWDNNKINPETAEKGAYIQARLDRILYFKSGEFTKDYTGENEQAIQAARITPEQLQQIASKMKMSDVIQEEIDNFLQEWGTEQMLGIPELAQYLSQVNPEMYPLDFMRDMLQQEYQKGGDEGLVDYLRKEAGISLQILGRGKYAFK